MSIARTCTVEGCDKNFLAKGMCDKHYKRAELSRKPLYQTWLSMKARCYNPNKNEYKHYGGRGISVCDRWINDYYTFALDMGDKPTSAHSIERVNVNGNYEPSNCVWATPAEQANNQRLRHDNTSGHVGVSFNKRDNLWSAYINKNGKRKIVGNFKTKELALNAYHLFTDICKQCDK